MKIIAYFALFEELFKGLIAKYVGLDVKSKRIKDILRRIRLKYIHIYFS